MTIDEIDEEQLDDRVIEKLKEWSESADVYYLDDFERKAKAKELLYRVEGEEYRTPLWTRKRMFWEAVDWAIEYMERNPPGTG